MARRRGGMIEVECTAEVDPFDVLDEIETEDLIAELNSRDKKGKGTNREEGLLAVHDLLLRKRTQEALAVLERILWPAKDIEAKYAKAKEHRDPETGRPLVQ